MTYDSRPVFLFAFVGFLPLRFTERHQFDVLWLCNQNCVQRRNRIIPLEDVPTKSGLERHKTLGTSCKPHFLTRVVMSFYNKKEEHRFTVANHWKSLVLSQHTRLTCSEQHPCMWEKIAIEHGQAVTSQMHGAASVAWLVTKPRAVPGRRGDMYRCWWFFGHQAVTYNTLQNR